MRSVFAVLLAACPAAHAAEYARPKAFTFLKQVPGSVASVTKHTFKTERIPGWLGMAAVTAGLVLTDKLILDWAQDLGHQLDIQPETAQKALPDTGGDFGLIKVPKNFGGALYFLGDGYLHLGIGAGFLVSGLIRDDARALRTASQIGEAYLVSGFFVQVVKRSTGRESPRAATSPTGEWTPFPGFGAYSKNTPHYDAVPSGHMATGTAVVTVLAKNYPEHPAIAPVGAALLSALGFQMLNNGVHWASDYPLAVYIGYMAGKTAFERAGPQARKAALDWRLAPTYIGRAPGAAFIVRY